jgi:hypothetical protein
MGGPLFLPSRWKRASVLRWLRRTHAWCGIWGGVFGLAFGATGILLNHRAEMKIPLVATVPSNFTIPVDADTSRTPEAMQAWLAAALQVPANRMKVQREAPRAVPWADGSAQQPARWEFSHSSPKGHVNAEYWVGNTVVSVKRREGNGFYLLTRLHMAQNAHPLWILAADSIAGCLIVLSISGVLMWTRLHGGRLFAASLFGIPLLALLGGALLSL